MGPQAEHDLSPEQLKQIEEVRQLILALDKATRAQKLYLANNPILVKQTDNLCQLFSNYLEEHGDLSLAVTVSDFLFLGESVYHNANRKESFSFRLFNEGMRGLRFVEGVTKNELRDFVTLLNAVTTDATVSEDPNAPMLWEREFEHITYEIAEYIIDDPEINIDEKMEQILDPNMANHMGPSPIGPPEDIEEEIPTDRLAPLSKFRDVAKQVCVLESSEFEQIQREIEHGEKHQRLMLDLFDILITLMLDAKDPEAVKKFLTILLETIDGTVLNGELSITAQLLWALRGLLEGGEGDFALRHPDRILAVIDSLGTQDRIKSYINSLNLGFTGSVKDIVNFFSSLPKTSFPLLLSNIHIVQSPQLRKEISIAISHLYDNKVEHFAKTFKTARSSQQILDALFILAHTRDTRAVPYLTPLLSNENRSVRLAAISTIKDLGIQNASNILLPLIEDSDSEIRIHALRTLAMTNDVSIGRLLLEKAQNNDFRNLDIQEKKSYFFAIAKLLRDDAIPFMKNTLGSKSFFKKQHMDDMYQCAAFALGVIGTDAASQMLQEFQVKGNKSVQHYCIRELKRTHAASEDSGR